MRYILPEVHDVNVGSGVQETQILIRILPLTKLENPKDVNP